MATSSPVYHAAAIEGGGGNNQRGTGMKWTPSTIALVVFGTIALVFPYVAIPVLFAVYKPNGTSQQVTIRPCNLFSFYRNGSFHSYSILSFYHCITTELLHKYNRCYNSYIIGLYVPHPRSSCVYFFHWDHAVGWWLIHLSGCRGVAYCVVSQIP